MASFSCFPMMVQHSQVGEIWAPNSRAFHAVGGPFTQWEVLFTDFHGDSRVFCAHPTFGAESREANIYCVLQFALYSLKIHTCFCTFQVCFAVCSLFSVLFCLFVMFVFGFAVCSLFLCKIHLCSCMFLLCVAACSLFSVSCFVSCSASSIFRSLLSFLRKVYVCFCMRLLCFAVCSLFSVLSLFFVMCLFCFPVCSLFSVLRFVFCYVSVIFHLFHIV